MVGLLLDGLGLDHIRVQLILEARVFGRGKFGIRRGVLGLHPRQQAVCATEHSGDIVEVRRQLVVQPIHQRQRVPGILRLHAGVVDARLRRQPEHPLAAAVELGVVRVLSQARDLQSAVQLGLGEHLAHSGERRPWQCLTEHCKGENQGECFFHGYTSIVNRPAARGGFRSRIRPSNPPTASPAPASGSSTARRCSEAGALPRSARGNRRECRRRSRECVRPYP